MNQFLNDGAVRPSKHFLREIGPNGANKSVSTVRVTNYALPFEAVSMYRKIQPILKCKIPPNNTWKPYKNPLSIFSLRH